MQSKPLIVMIALALVSTGFFSMSRGDVGTDAASPATAPAAQAAPRSAAEMRALQTDLQSTSTELSRVMPSREALMDPAARAKAGAAAIPTLTKMVHLLNEVLPVVAPQSKPALVAMKYRLIGTLSLLDDADAQKTLETDAAATDKDVAVAAQLAQLTAGWLRNHTDAGQQAKVLDQAEKLVKDDPASNNTATSVFAMSQSGAATPELQTRAKTIALSESTSPFAKQQQKMAQDQAKLAALENQPLVIQGKNLDGRAFSSSEYRGKVVLVDFWATWCGPCKAELPRIKEVYRQNHDKGFEIIGVSCDTDGDKLKEFLQADPAMSWVQLYEPGAKLNPLAVQYGIDIIPRMILIDRNGVCRTVEARANLEQLLPTLLAESAVKPTASN